MIKKILNFKFVIHNCQRGMTYIELIVVLSIFSVVTSITLFDYNKFQQKVDIKVLANDIALKIIEAQKSSTSGKWNSNASSENWKPSYGVYFNTSDNRKNFIYFADMDNSNSFEGSGCDEECLEETTITKGNYISNLSVVGTGCPSVDNLSILFMRPNSSAVIVSDPVLSCDISYAQVSISSPKSMTANIKIYPSGRVEIN